MGRDCPRFGVGLGIVDRGFDFQMPEIRALETLNDFARFGDRTSFHIEPAQVPQTDGFDYQRAAVPLADRVTVPPGLSIGGQRPAVDEYLPDACVCLV